MITRKRESEIERELNKLEREIEKIRHELAARRLRQNIPTIPPGCAPSLASDG